ncbi:DUF4386 domain-containing protein [Thalassobius aquimarinus]|uniref:DUF4386 domain-containing protein n=1 Tax=Thalassovita aquimarina TaxID=2785917 RepID=A0ABS5HVJ4_9RHOB|nr:DUF4386 domain-containing protein [Thalassovita aquimarina]
MLSVAPAIDSPEYLFQAAQQPSQVKIAAMGQVLLGLCYLGFALLLFPVVRHFGETLSLGFLSFRILAASVAIVATVVMLAILNLSQLVEVHRPDEISALTTLGDVLRGARDQLNHVFMVMALCAGNTMFFLLTFRAQLLPSWLSLWGIAGAGLSVAASGAVLFAKMEIITVEYIALNLPTATAELLVGFWLLFKGLQRAPQECPA